MIAAPLKTFNISENVTQVLAGEEETMYNKANKSLKLCFSLFQFYLCDREQIAVVWVTFHSSLKERYLSTVKTSKIKMKRMTLNKIATHQLLQWSLMITPAPVSTASVPGCNERL